MDTGVRTLLNPGKIKLNWDRSHTHVGLKLIKDNWDYPWYNFKCLKSKIRITIHIEIIQGRWVSNFLNLLKK